MKRKIIGIVLTAIICSCFDFASAARLTEIIQYHFQLSSVYGVKSSSDSKSINTNLWYLLKESEKHLQENMETLLKEESTRRKNLNAYITDWTKLMNALWYWKNRLNNELQNVASKIQYCQNQLTNANQKFITSLNIKNEAAFNQAVNIAKASRKCIWEEQVTQSSTRSLLNLVQNYTTKIEKRHNYLKNNQTLIIRHYDVLKPSLLKELYPISVELEN